MRSLDYDPVIKRTLALIPRQHGRHGNTELSGFNGTFGRTGMAGPTPRRSREPQRGVLGVREHREQMERELM